jgi:hypothetical protein
MLLTIDKTLDAVSEWRRHETRRDDSRPHLRALLGDDGEACLLFAELNPRERAERVQRRRELWGASAKRRGCNCVSTYS